jgi:diphosphomevalonate decarboxylase
LRVVIAITSEAPKDVGSREGMARSRDTSPFYAAWVGSHDADLQSGMDCVRRRDFAALAEVAEHNCLKMHAVMMSSRPPLTYWMPATLACMRTVQALRRSGVPVFFTVDAGPQVKAVCEPQAASKVTAALMEVPGVSRLVTSGLGLAAHVADG